MSKIEVADEFTFSLPSENGDGVDTRTLFKDISDSLETDLFLYSGPIERPHANLFIDTVEANKRSKNIALVICTLGGDADAAYIMARFAKSNYEKFRLYVFGHCKSAGTLLALGADEIVMSHRGELGPLDVQLLKTDELLFRGSGLDIGKAIESLSDRAFQMFESYFISLIKKGGGAITTKTASEIATSMAVGLISPITAQIDPLRVGEVERAINVAHEYGTRLNASEEKVHALIHHYPSHSFVIDYEEATDLFKNIRRPNEAELMMEQVLQNLKDDDGRKCIRKPHSKGLVAYLNPEMENTNEPAQEPAEVRDTISNNASAPASGPEREGQENETSPSQQPVREAVPARQAESGNTENGSGQRTAHQGS